MERLERLAISFVNQNSGKRIAFNDRARNVSGSCLEAELKVA
jgi:hypothetical protein